MTKAQKEANKRWREKNPDKVREYVKTYMRKYRKAHPDRVKAAVQKYYTSEKGRQHQKEYYKKNCEKLRKYRQKLHSINTIEDLIRESYKNAVQRVLGQGKDKWAKENYAGMEIVSWHDFFQFSLDDPNLPGLFKAWNDAGRPRKIRPCIDRIDHEKGYTIDNIQWITVSVNSKRQWGQHGGWR